MKTTRLRSKEIEERTWWRKEPMEEHDEDSSNQRPKEEKPLPGASSPLPPSLLG